MMSCNGQSYLRHQLFRLTLSIILIEGYALVNQSWAQEVFDFTPDQRTTQQSPNPQKQSKPRLLPTLPLIAQYRGEETRGVRYLSSKERANTRLHVSKGLLLDQKKQRLNLQNSPPKTFPLTQFPDQPPVTQALASGFAIYVMDAQGQISISFQAQPHKFHHSSLAAGKPVAAAGEMIIFAGKLYAINNRSGHYRPPPLALDRTLKVLTKMGVKLEGVFIKRYGSNF